MSLRTEILWALGLGLGLMLVMFHMEPAAASGNWWDHDHPHDHPEINTVNGTDGADGRDGRDGMSGNEYNGGMAAVMAADAIHCTTSSRKHQMGVGIGNSDGQNGAAVGYCNSIELWESPVMFGIKATTAEDTDNKYSIGLNWTW